LALHHVNFHTLHRKPVFENESYERMMRRCIADVIATRGILCPVWEIMSTHVHFVVEDFADLTRATVMKHLKGDTSRAFFATFPDLRADLDGGHLWQRGYYAVAILTHSQYLATLEYIRLNRARVGLAPPEPLRYVGNG
jgi:putative transposase